MEIVYDIMDPTGNVTILVETPVEEALQPALALRLLEAEPAAEQVGYVTFLPDGMKLRMAGGEFCGNATMSTAVLGVMRGSGQTDAGAEGITADATCQRYSKDEMTVYASGAQKPVTVKVECRDGEYYGTISMPVPKDIVDMSYEYNGKEYILPTVIFDGITHAVMQETMAADDAEKAVRQWCHDIGSDGLGLMLLDRDESQITPVVYVECPETLYWESSCASGTTAVSAYLAKRNRAALSRDFIEPGGVLHVEVSDTGKVELTGHVRCISERKTIEL